MTRQVEILLMQFDPEAGLEIPLHHAFAVHFENSRRSETAHESLPHERWIGAGLRCKQQRFPDRLNRQAPR